MALNLSDLQAEVKNWSYFNFGEDEGPEASMKPLIGVQEELGELSHCVLKTVQKVRTSEDHKHNSKDAVGDIMIYLIDFCNRWGVSLEECITIAWNEVKERNWKYSPTDGNVPESGGIEHIYQDAQVGIGGYDHVDQHGHIIHIDGPEVNLNDL